MIKLNGMQSIMLAASSFLPLTYFFMPRTAVTYGGYYALWSTVCLAVVGPLIAWIHARLCACFPDMTGADYNVTLYGPWIGRMISALYVPFYVLFVDLAIYYFVQVLKAFLPQTPALAIVTAMVLVAFVGARYGLETLARTATIIYLLTFFGNFVTMLFLLVSHWRESPIIFSFGRVNQISNGVYHLLPVFLGFSFVMMITPYYKKTTFSLWSMVLNGILVITNFLTTITVLGYEAPNHIRYTFPFVLMLLRLSGFFIERVGVSVVILATAFTLVFLANHIWALSTLTSRIIGRPDSDYQRFILPISVILCVSVASMSDGLADPLLDNVLTPVSWVLLVVIPLTDLIVAKLKGFPHKQRGRAQGSPR